MLTIEVSEELTNHYDASVFDRTGTLVSFAFLPVYHAQVQGNPRIRGSGDSIDAAVGSLVRNHPETLGAKVEYRC